MIVVLINIDDIESQRNTKVVQMNMFSISAIKNNNKCYNIYRHVNPFNPDLLVLHGRNRVNPKPYIPEVCDITCTCGLVYMTSEIYPNCVMLVFWPLGLL